jgi:hypothetical protein
VGTYVDARYTASYVQIEFIIVSGLESPWVLKKKIREKDFVRFSTSCFANDTVWKNGELVILLIAEKQFHFSVVIFIIDFSRCAIIVIHQNSSK